MTAAVADTKSSLAPPLRKQPVMEDRKRPLIDGASDETPPSKRQAMTTPDEPQTQEDVVNFQKEAIYRQMKAYKREKELTEGRLQELQIRCTYHDDHIRVIDAWLDQLLDEVRVMAVDSELLEKQPQQNGETHDRTSNSLLFADVETFSDHLSKRQDSIKETLSTLLKRFETRTEVPDKIIPKLQKRLSELLAAEKTHRVELDRISQEKDDAEQQLTLAAIRYLTAEKKLDRLKSQTVLKIEQQATNNASSSNGTSKKDANSSSKAKFTDGQLADAELARKEAEAIASKQEKEIKQLQAEISRLQEQVTNYNLKLGRLSEEDIVNCETYKNARLRLEDVVTKLNHIEALNGNLSRENESLHAERTAYKKSVEAEQSVALVEANAHIVKSESDLARIRAFRDQLHAELHTQRIAAEKMVVADYSEELRKLVESQKEKIASLEGEVQRLRLEAGQEPIQAAEDIVKLSHQELIDGMTKLRASHNILEHEFKSIESAYKKAHDVGKAKFDDLRTFQDTITRMKQDKIRNEQKVFEAVKLKEGAMDKARLFQSQHEKASEIIMNLKNSDKKQTSLIANLEKQLAELRLINNQAALAQKSSQTTTAELKNTVEALQRQLNSMKESLKKAEDASRTENNKKRNAENELEKTLVRLNSLEQSVKAFSSEENEESTLEGFRSMVRCGVCRTGQKSRVIRTCGHLFCKDCIEDRITTRNRKCPNCGRQFAATDVLSIVL
ncbi:hypothetical protein ABW20_dc0106091 [Dactylellina cionopaga]|nr:hypothetical protein ABW20_dc0106091 [Dactylellina cionopaga]